MNRKDRIEFDKQAEALYKPMMQKLILEWRHKYDSSTIRECFCYWVCKHNHEKIMDLVNHRKHRKLQYRKIKTELENVKAEKLIADPFSANNEDFKL